MSRRSRQWQRAITQARYEPNPTGSGNVRYAKSKEQAMTVIRCTKPEKAQRFARLVERIYR